MTNQNEPTNLRHELKLACSAALLHQARTWIQMHPAGFRPTFPRRQISNLYLDTLHLNSLGANQAGVSTRQKLRLRWYGETGNHLICINPTLELKIKQNLLGDKKQQKLNCKIDWTQPFIDILQTIQAAAGDDWQQWLTTAQQPTLINQYKRDYFETIDGTLRLTLDFDQVAFDQRLGTRPNLSRPVHLDDLIVIELKGAPEHLDQLQEAMAYFPISRSRNSKYVNGMVATWM